MTLYEQLGISQDASQGEIKRAYFAKVRQFSPEKDPETFKLIRRAYETLSNREKREDYDFSLMRFKDTSEETADLLMKTEVLIRKGLPEEAMELLKKSKDFSKKDVQKTLCFLYLVMEKNGKAVKIAEKLISKYPEDPDVLRLVAKAYHARGWNKKIDGVLERLYEIDPGNEFNSQILLLQKTDLHPLEIGMEIEEIEETGNKAPLLCAHALNNIFKNVPEPLIYSFRNPNYGKSNDNPWDEPLYTAEKLAEYTVDIPDKKRSQLYVLFKTEIFEGMLRNGDFSILPHIKKAIENIKAPELFNNPWYDAASVAYETICAVQSGIPRKMAALALMRRWSQFDIFENYILEDYKRENTVLEIEILESFASCSFYLPKFRENFSSLYQYAADFFDMLEESSESKIENEIRRRFPMAMKINSRLRLDWLGKDDEIIGKIKPRIKHEPVRTSKIGRNEPCPCGSGKKYKKCCGI